MKYIGKIIKTETKELEIKRESATCVYVRTDNCYKDIAIAKSSLIEENDTVRLYFSVTFKAVITHTDFQLKELGFENAKQRKQEFIDKYNR
jgi:hypothetical protein